MEGDGEGMVAIVQGLKDAGLAVTLMGASGRCKLNGAPGQLTHAKSSVETSTKPLMSQTGAQICDDTYTSSYQLAHCNIRPSSPPVLTPEFPLQRSQHNRTQGNFQVGSGANDGCHFSNGINLSARNGFMIPNRDFQSSRGTEPFIQSLRKYPSISTQRSASSDLVQRLLVYTQAKNFSKGSSHFERIKNLPNKITTEKPAEISSNNCNRNKSVQTYTRMRRIEKRDDIKKTSKEASRTNRTSIRDTRYKNNQVNETFDYLRSPSPRPFNVDTEVRYLNEVTRRLRDALRPICDHRTQVCPNMQSRYSHHRRQHHGATIGQNSSSDSNNMEAQASVQMVSTGVPNSLPREDVPGIQAEHSSEQYNKRCCYCHEPLPCHCSPRYSSDSIARESGYAKNIEDQVYDWLKEIPIYINEKPQDQHTRQYLVKDLIDRLNSLPRDEYYEENAKNEILECVNNLPMWQPMNKHDKEDFKSQVIDNLMNKIRHISCDSDDKKVILKLVDDISFDTLDSLGELVDKQYLKDNVIHKLNSLVTNPPLPDKLKAEIIKMLKELPIKVKGDKSRYISNLGDKFVHKLKHLSKDTTKDKADLQEYVKQISDWVEDIPELYSTSIGHNEKLVMDLAKKLKALNPNGISDTTIQENLREEIIKWLEDNTTSHLGTKSKVTLSEKLLQDFNRAALLKAKNKNSLLDPVLDWLEDIPEIKGTKFENYQEAEILSKTLNDLQSEGNTGDMLVKEITAWLGRLLKIKNERVEPRTQIELAKNLINKINSTKNDPMLQDDIHTNVRENINLYSKENKINAQEPQEVKSQKGEKSKDNKINRILDDEFINIDNMSKNEIKSKILSVISKPSDRFKLEDNDDTLMQITDIIKKGTQLSNKEAKNTAKEILRAMQTIPQDSRLSISQDLDLKNALKEEINHVLDDTDITFENRDDIETKLSNVLVEQMMRCETDAKVKDYLTSILKNANISDEESEKVATDLIAKGKIFSLSYNSQRSSETLSTISKTEKSKTPRVVAYSKIKKTILDYTSDITSSIRNYGEAAEELAERIVDILDSDDSLDEEKKKLQREVKKYFQDINIDFYAESEDQALELVDKLQSLTPKTSTPRRSIDKGLPFLPRRNSDDSTLSAILSDKLIEQFKRKKAPSKVEEQYTSQLVHKIGHWMRNLNIDINSKDQKAFKDIMVRDLASDIVDRQKYLQLNPSVKSSDEEELEHLNYQVFRWLNKLPNIKRLLSSLSKTKELMDLIKTVSVPQLIKDKIPTSDIASTMSKQVGDLKSLHKEISTWIESIPSNQYTSLYKDFHRQMIKKLTEDINHIQSNETLTETALDNLLSEWLHKMVYDQSSIQNLSEGLKAILINKKLIALSPDVEVARENSRIIQEDIRSMILDWLKEKPFYKKRSSAEKRLQEQTAAELSKALKDTLENENFVTDGFEKDAVFLQKIKSHIKKMPMDAYLKNDMQFLNSMASELLSCLKNLEQFQNLTVNHSQHINDILVKEIEEWMKTLPLKSQITSSDRQRLENTKEEIKEKLKAIQNQLPSSKEFDENLKSNIKKCLLQIPLEFTKKQDEAFLEQKIEDLQEILHRLGENQPSRRLFLDVSAIKYIVQNWLQNLPFQKGKTVKDIETNIVNYVSSLRRVFQNSQLDGSIQKRNILEELTSKFIHSLPLQKDKLTNECVSDLVNKLLDFLNSMSVSNTTDAVHGNDSVTTSVFKNSTDVLYDELMKWCEDLPIQEENTPNDQSRIKTIKQNIVSKLINKIADLNMQPEIFNDASLYEDLLKDEIDELLSTLPLNYQSQKNLKTFKNDLLDKVKKAKEKTRNELAGHAYKQQLRDAISNTLPSTKNIMEEEKIPFEILKDNLADAFINLYYFADSDELKNRYKQQITNEINKFCNEYLKRFPATPMDPNQLNQQLYTVLQKVPVPKNETIKTQVEQMRIKDEIIDCLENLPIDHSPSGELQKRKIVSILAKELYDIEEEKDSYPKFDIEDRMKQNIIKWINKLPVRRGAEYEIDKVAEKLVKRLKLTEVKRKNNIANSPPVSTSGISPKVQRRTQPSKIPSKDNFTQYSLPLKEPLKQYSPPKSTLNSEDRENLERIRQRVKTSSTSPQNMQSKDASVSPKPVEVGNQTHIGEQVIQPLNSQSEQINNFLPHHQSTNQPISPNVVVNEYNWENTDPTMTSRHMHYAYGYQTPNTQNQNFANTNQSQLPLINQQQQSEPYSLPNQNIQDLGYHNLNYIQSPLATQGLQREHCSLPNQNMPNNSYRSNLSEAPLVTQAQQTESYSLPTQNMQNLTYQNINQSQSPSTTENSQKNTYTLPNQSSYGSMPPPDTPTQSPFIIQQLPNSVPQPPRTSSQSTYIDQPPYMAQRNSLEMPQPSCPESPLVTAHTPPPSMPQMRLFSSRSPPGTSRDVPSRSPPAIRAQSGIRSPDISSTSPFEQYDESTKRSYKDQPRGTKFGSFDDANPCSKCCDKQSPKAKKHNESPDEDSEWTIRFPEDTDWGTPCPRRRARSYRISAPKDGQLIKERKEEKTKCHCRERILTKCINRRPKTYNHTPCLANESPMHHCPKCCGMHCPHPSYLFFK